jgi:hypothetical protein
MSALLTLPTTIVDTMLAKIANGETGGTFAVNGNSVPNHGYFINPTRDQMIDFVEVAGADYVGFWEDSETLALYVDAVDWTPNEAAARRLCELRGEIAYWDVSKGDEVRV